MAARRERFSVVIGAVDQVAAPIRSVNRHIQSMTGPLRKVRNEAKALAREAGLTKLGSSLGNVGQQVRRLGLVGGAALGGLFYAVKRTGAAADELADLGTQTGLTAQQLQELEHAAGIASVSSSVFRQSISALAKRVGELKAGGGALNTLLGKVDPKFQRLLASSTSTEEALGLILGKIRELPNPLQQSALAAAAFSRSGLRMVNVAKLSEEELAALRKQARDEGGVFSDQAVKDAGDMGDALDTLTLSVRGVWTEISGSLFPVVTEIADGLRGWLVENRKLVVSGATEFVREFVSAGRSLLGVLREWIPPIVQVVKRFGGAKLVLGALAVGVLAPLVIAIGGVVSALGSIAVAVGAVVGPIAAAVGVSTAAFVAMGAALGAVVTTVIAYWDEIKAAVFGAVDAIRERISALVNLIPEPVRNLLSAVWNWEGLAGAGVRLPAPLFELSAPGGAAPAPAAAAAGGSPFGGTGAAELRLRIDQDGRFKDATLDPKGAAIELDQGGALGAEW